MGIPHTTVADHLRRAAAAGLSWPLPDEMDDPALEALLFPKGPAPASSDLSRTSTPSTASSGVAA